jgi:hypothetical protein
MGAGLKPGVMHGARRWREGRRLGVMAAAWLTLLGVVCD